MSRAEVRRTELMGASTPKPVTGPVIGVSVSLTDRRRGLSSQTTVAGGLILNTAHVQYDWQKR